MHFMENPGRKALHAIALVACLVALPTALRAATIVGAVMDDHGDPLAGALVKVDGTSIRALTDGKGTYELRNVPAGSVVLRAGMIGYSPASKTISVRAGETEHADFRLAPSPIPMAQVDVLVGSRAPHTAADELAVPVDVYTQEKIAQQGTSETSQILQNLSPSVNFPRQSVTDATDIVRPFTLRGLSPDHTLVLINGARRHQTAVVNTFAYGTAAGSSGVDLNAIPASAIDRIEVLRDGASAQYGSDAIAGVVNLVTRKGRFHPFINATSGRYTPNDYADDGTSVDVNGGWGIGLGRATLAVFGEFLNRQPTNRAWADPYDASYSGQVDSVDATGHVIVKRNPVPQPNHHWGDGLEKDLLSYADFRLPLDAAATSQFYAHGGYSFRKGTGFGYRRYADSDRNWAEIYPVGYLPQYVPDVTDYSGVGGVLTHVRGWTLDVSGSGAHNDFQYNLTNTLNVSLGPCLGTPCAPGPDGQLGTSDDPNIPNQTDFYAGAVSRNEIIGSANASKSVDLGMRNPVNVALGAAFRREEFGIAPGERASWIDGGHTNVNGEDAPGGSQVFPGFTPSDSVDASRNNVGGYVELESTLSPTVLANVAGRFEHYSDFGSLVTGKGALRVQPSRRVTLRAAGSTGFRAPGLGQSHFSKVITNFIGGEAVDVGVFPVESAASVALGAKPLKAEKSANLSAGIAVSPADNLTLTADAYQITITDRILLGATFDDEATQQLLADAGITNVGGVQYFTNGLDTRTRGLDFTGELRVPVGEGAIQFSAAADYSKNTITRVDPLPQELLDANSTESGLLDTVTRVAITEERPDWRVTFTPTFTLRAFHALARMSYFGKFASAQPGFCDECREEYGAKTLFDAEAGHKFQNVDLSVGVRNAFDTYPDRATMDFNNNFGTFPWAAASPFGYNGRYVYARASLPLMD